MGIMYITEYQSADVGTGGAIQVAHEPRIADQVITFTTHVESAAFNAKTKLVRLETDSICSFTIGTTPTATTSMSRMVAGQTEYFGVNPGDKVSAVSNT
jgi:hypothetical protein